MGLHQPKHTRFVMSQSLFQLLRHTNFTSGMAAFEPPEEHWPRRLLHVQSMISHERTGEFTYDGVEKPKYNILSYTWGRWQADPGNPVLPVTGIGWDVPPIDPKHFTVAEFQNVVNQVAGKKKYIWLDIACIDQANPVEMRAEMGRQAGIYHKARHARVWLSQIRTADLARLALELEHRMRDAEGLVGIGMPAVNAVGWLDDTIAMCRGFLADPWFSSLWTLQEAWLRKDAVLLSREGESVMSGLRVEITVNDIARYMSTLYREILNYTITTRGPYDMIKATNLLRIIHQSGLPSLNSTNAAVLLPITRFRRTFNELDRVYGIMQVYGLRLGSSAVGAGDQTFTLNQLELQLSTGLNQLSTLGAQLLVHTKRLDPGQSWQINTFSEAPTLADRIIHDRGQDGAQISVTDGRAKFIGDMCPFDKQLVEMWRNASDTSPIQEILLDSSDFADRHFPNRLVSANMDDGQHRVARMLVQELGGRLFVLRLGQGIQHRAGHRSSVTVGLIMLRYGQGQGIYYGRMGICAWETRLEEEIHWTPTVATFGPHQ